MPFKHTNDQTTMTWDTTPKNDLYSMACVEIYIPPCGPCFEAGTKKSAGPKQPSQQRPTPRSQSDGFLGATTHPKSEATTLPYFFSRRYHTRKRNKRKQSATSLRNSRLLVETETQHQDILTPCNCFSWVTTTFASGNRTICQSSHYKYKCSIVLLGVSALELRQRRNSSN